MDFKPAIRFPLLAKVLLGTGRKAARNIPAVEIPVYLFVGRFDHNDPAELTAQYFQHLDTPIGKHLVWFENSAYDLFFDEPPKRVQETLAILDKTK
jgi:pimeloyl-ACP methyl ester carboxylesterase